tara:strand:+ start:413 stop:769 length:357 start_codon:yes stop_codon:yes gene_type:complete
MKYSLNSPFYTFLDDLALGHADNDYNHRNRHRINIKDSGDVYLSEINLAGFAKADVKITANDDEIKIAAKNKERSQEYKINLYGAVSIDHITSQMKNGLLILTLPKKGVAERRDIEIK